MSKELEQILEDAATEVARMKARNDAADERELKAGRATVPSALPFGPAYDPRTRKLDLKEADIAFLEFCRTGRESKALVENEVGQYLVSPEITAEIERRLPEIVIMRGLASQRSIQKDRVQLRGIGEASVGWGRLETNTEITESTMTPTPPVFKYVEDLYGLSKIGEDELADSDVNLANILADSFSMNVAEAEELAFVSGLGHENHQQPAGWKVDETLVAAAIRSDTKDVIAIEDLLKMVFGLPPKYRKRASFMVHSLTALELRKLRARGGNESDGNEGAFLWRDSPILGQPPTLHGYPVYTMDHLDTLADTEGIIAAFGNFKLGYRILDRTNGMTVQRLSELYAEAGLVGFKLHKRVGGYVIQADRKPIVLLREKAT